VTRTIAYCRVSLRDQNPQLQLDALHANGYDQLFAEKESGKHGTARLSSGPACWTSIRWTSWASGTCTQSPIRT